MRRASLLCLVPMLAAACGGDGSADERSADAATTAERSAQAGAATALGDGVEGLSPEALEAGRLDPGWRPYAERHAAAARAGRSAGTRAAGAGTRGAGQAGPGGRSSSADTAGGPSAGDPRSVADGWATWPDSSETWEDISAGALGGEPALPLSGDVAGPSVAMVQIALDRALFSPGIIDGRWGKNTEKAVFWLQERHDLEATGTVDQATWRRIRELAGTGELVREHTLTEDDVSGPFVDIPGDIYAQAELDCMCYESRPEKLAERFHTSIALLEQLNPGTSLRSAAAGQTLIVPAVRGDGGAGRGSLARLVVSDGGHYVHALDAEGELLYHFPSTLGSEYDPSPGGSYEIQAIAPDPTWHYQPDILEGEPDDARDAIIPPGPNNPVGVVWMALTKPHYGIHGTSAPETIGYVTSSGCVRLTNWDAAFLHRQVEAGTPVDFVD